MLLLCTIMFCSLDDEFDKTDKAEREEVSIVITILEPNSIFLPKI